MKKSGKNHGFSASRSYGFTLLEVIISVFILSIGTLTVLGLISDSLQVVSVTKKAVIAANLAQEGIEAVRGIRDGNWIQGESYDNGLTSGDSCVNYNSTSLISPCADSTIYWNGSKYSHSGGSATDFLRTINIANDSDSEGLPYLRVRSTVSWDSRSIMVEDHLYDWR
ncbi:MAG: prepilin-type N-terminal cleavage/methylation domain-containing protein [Candidatus Spechtbacterales bacterium]